MNEITKECSNYIFFSSFQLLAIGILPAIMALFPNMQSYYQASVISEEYIPPFIHWFQEGALLGISDSYLIMVVTILTLNVTFKWNSDLNSGSFGYWLTLDVNRRDFLIRSTAFMILFFSIDAATTVLIWSGIGGYYFSYMDLFTFFILISLQISIFTVLAFLFALIIPNPEISSVIYLSISFGLLTYVEPNRDFILSSLVPYKFWITGDILPSIYFAFIIIILLFGVCIRMLGQKDVKL